MALPELTEEQRAAALEKAMRLRSQRAETLRKIKSGEVPAAQCLVNTRRGFSAYMEKVKVKAFLEAVPGVGKAKSSQIMERLGILERHSLRSIGDKQAQAVLAELESLGAKSK